jgi:hypothetical protein
LSSRYGDVAHPPASITAVHAVRKCPAAARNWYSQPGDGLADTVAAARVRVHVLAFRGASGVRPRVRASVNREPQPAPPRARLPHLRRLLVRQARERASRSPSPMVSCSAIQARTCSPSASGGSSRVSSARERLLIEPAGIQRIRPRGQARIQPGAELPQLPPSMAQLGGMPYSGQTSDLPRQKIAADGRRAGGGEGGAMPWR